MELHRLGLKPQGVSVVGCLHVWASIVRAKRKNSLRYVRVQGEVSDETGKEVQDVKASNSFLSLLFLSPQIQSIFFLPLPDRSPGLRKSSVRLITYDTYLPEYVARRNWTLVGNGREVWAPTVQVRESELQSVFTRSYFDFASHSFLDFSAFGLTVFLGNKRYISNDS